MIRVSGCNADTDHPGECKPHAGASAIACNTLKPPWTEMLGINYAMSWFATMLAFLPPENVALSLPPPNWPVYHMVDGRGRGGGGSTHTVLNFVHNCLYTTKKPSHLWTNFTLFSSQTSNRVDLRLWQSLFEGRWWKEVWYILKDPALAWGISKKALLGEAKTPSSCWEDSSQVTAPFTWRPPWTVRQVTWRSLMPRIERLRT